MTAPTSPGVVPADVRTLAIKAWDVAEPMHTNAEVVHVIEQAIMADRANRPSLTEDERGQVRRKALEFYRDNWLTLSDTGEPYEPNDALWKDKGDIARRALADRSEPRQEKEGGDA